MVAVADPAEAARQGLVWWSDTEPAIRRIRSGRGFRYLDPEGMAVNGPTIDRIRKLAIPPAWTDVRICPSPDGYLQATGRDAKGRKQYRYHPDWRTAREEAKFTQLLAFGEALPRIRERVEQDLGLPGLQREKVLALVVRLLDLTHARVGNEEYARGNHSFGLATLWNRHATVEGSKVHFRFRGKAGKFHDLGISDRRLAQLVRRCRELPGRHLFEYLDEDGVVRTVRSEDVNAYLREAAGVDVTAKMFRTWAATVLAGRLLAATQPPEAPGAKPSKKAVKAAVEAVADRLGNTPTVARNAYIHPAVPQAYALGELQRAVEEEVPAGQPWTAADEAATLELLRAWVHQAGRRVQGDARRA